ncbi:uncharacterized protein LTR77_001013 [Saxophila tyrrhenica]|uniref:Heterokaryon incompatibility domain-containing protein n=1 Tax=Saxophila tyrrhenica TaxID=1690608 RepID=A0AAV9PU55_9PEZI|nr:hypothetical protein LTR77_001013 [Saxophila tyrrhenica]
MRLLNVHTLQFKEFFDHQVPPYGILSHRWSDDEITFKDFRKGRRKEAAGYKKVLDFCAFVKKRKIFDLASPSQERPDDVEDGDGQGGTPVNPIAEESLEWIWVDTMCINKQSSQELSEAINSMFTWYQEAKECYVYMNDVAPNASTPPYLFWNAFDSSEWFNRGWTLQELLAPSTVVFCDRTWEVFGHLGTAADSEEYVERVPGSGILGFPLNERISRITGIQLEYLSHDLSVASATIARRMSWAAHRQTTRLEDRAYSLMGLFDVNMPLLYGEGPKALLRLQEEIIKSSYDRSIFPWRYDNPDAESTGVLAPDVKCFQHCGDVIYKPSVLDRVPFAMSNLGLHIRLSGRELDIGLPPGGYSRSKLFIAILHGCVRELDGGRFGYMNLIILQCQHGWGPKSLRSRLNCLPHGAPEFGRLSARLTGDTKETQLYIKVWGDRIRERERKRGDACRECLEAERRIIGQLGLPRSVGAQPPRTE